MPYLFINKSKFIKIKQAGAQLQAETVNLPSWGVLCATSGGFLHALLFTHFGGSWEAVVAYGYFSSFYNQHSVAVLKSPCKYLHIHAFLFPHFVGTQEVDFLYTTKSTTIEDAKQKYFTTRVWSRRLECTTLGGSCKHIRYTSVF